MEGAAEEECAESLVQMKRTPGKHTQPAVVAAAKAAFCSAQKFAL